MKEERTFNRQINNRKEAHITKIEFAKVEEDHIIVRFTCQTSRPTTTDVITFLHQESGDSYAGELESIHIAISTLRERHPGTKITLDPNAELEPIDSLGSCWNCAWHEPLYRARLGLTWTKSFPMTKEDMDQLEYLDDRNERWGRDNGRLISQSSN